MKAAIEEARTGLLERGITISSVLVRNREIIRKSGTRTSGNENITGDRRVWSED